MPQWLSELEAEIGAQPDIADTAKPAVSVEMPLPAEGMPSWLTELEVEIGEEPAAPPSAKEPAITLEVPEEPAAVEVPPPVDGMPPWLVELEAEIGGPTVVSTVAAPTIELPELPIEPADVEPPLVLEEAPGLLDERVLETIVPSPESVPEDMPEWTADLEVDAEVTSAVPAAEMITVSEAKSEPIPEVDVESVDALEQLEVLQPESTEIDLQSVFLEEPTPLAEQEDQPEWLQQLEAETVDQVTVEEMPDWLEQVRSAETAASPTEAQEPGEEMEWLQELRDLEVPPAFEPETVPPAEETIAEAIPTAAVEPPEAAPVEEVEPESVLADRTSESPEQSLSQARAYLSEGALDAAAKEYERLATIAAVREEVIQDLEQYIVDNPGNHALLCALGDAYKHAGELHRALSTYKKALARL
jgi:hypothetical protein